MGVHAYMRRPVGDPHNERCTSCGDARVVIGQVIACPACDSTILWPERKRPQPQ